MDRRIEPVAGASLAFVEALYASYLEDPSSVGEDWRRYFAQLAAEDGDASLRGTVKRYDDPTEPVAMEDWEALE